MAKKITFNEKSHIKPYGSRDTQVWDLDLNEIKEVVNANADEIAGFGGGYQGLLLIADTPINDGYYMAGESGTYTNAGGLVVNLTSKIVFINASETQTVFTLTEIPISLLENELTDVSVTWVSDLIFDVRADNYPIDGAFYSATRANVTLTPADATHGRIDLLIADINGNVGFITGVPSESPLEPNYDFATQYPIKFVLVAASATTPVGYIVTSVFDENLGQPDEWVFSSIDANVTVTTNTVSSGLSSIEANGQASYAASKFLNDVSFAWDFMATLVFDVYLTQPFATIQLLLENGGGLCGKQKF